MIKYVVSYYNSVFQNRYEINCENEYEALSRTKDLKSLIEIKDIKVEKREVIEFE